MSGRSKKYSNEKVGQDSLADQVIDEQNGGEEVKADAESSEEVSEELQKRITELENEVFEYRDRLVRKAAEFENYRKRTSEEYVRLINTASEDLIVKLLPVMDDIERFGKNFSENINPADLKKGVDLIFSKLDSILKSAGLDEIEALGTQFDPELHDAMMTVEKDGEEPNTVVDQYEKGYKLNDKVIRHSKVIVSK